MSINSSPFHSQSQGNFNINNFIQQDFNYQDKSKDIYNNPINNSMNLYNQYHSPMSVNKEEINHQLIQGLTISNKTQINEIELNMVIKKSENSSSLEKMKVTINKKIEKQPSLIIQITNPNDPLFLYTLELTELEYQQLKIDQSLLVDFQSFPDFITKMIFFCKNDKDDIYTCVFKIGSLGEKNYNVGNTGILSIEEKTQYRKLNHLILKFQSANDTTLKKYLSDISKEYKDKYEDLLQKFNDLNKNFDIFQKESALLKEKYQKLEYENKSAMDNLLNEKNKEINLLKENNFKETKEKLESLESEKNKIISELENKISQLQGIIDDATKNKTKLEEHKLKLEINQKDLEGKFAISNTELNVYKSEITNLRQENSDLNQKCLNLEKKVTESNFKSESMSKELEEKNQNLENLKQLVDSLNKQRESNEDAIKSLKASNNKFENKLQISIKEINKANDIIQKLQNEIKNQKSKVKSLKNELNTQEQLINQKQMLLDEQNRTIKDIKRESEAKEQEIIGLKNQISNYQNKLNENEKLIEENKQMILYLNKNINENSNNPFRSRFNYNNSLDNNKINSGTFDNNISNNMTNLNINSNIPNLKTNIDLNNNLNTNMNINSLNKYSNNIGLGGNENEPQFGIHSQTSNKQTGNYLQNSLSSNTSGMIMPETNFTGYQFKDKVSGIQNKYSNNYTGYGVGTGGNLLAHKYGGSSMNNHNDNNENENYGISNSKNTDYNNIEEEEYPRTLEQPQSKIIRK